MNAWAAKRLPALPAEPPGDHARRQLLGIQRPGTGKVRRLEARAYCSPQTAEMTKTRTPNRANKQGVDSIQW